MDTLKKLQSISDSLDGINRELTQEERVWAEELADRQRLGLEGNAAIEHYNEWMDQHGMGHLKINSKITQCNQSIWRYCKIFQEYVPDNI